MQPEHSLRKLTAGSQYRHNCIVRVGEGNTAKAIRLSGGGTRYK